MVTSPVVKTPVLPGHLAAVSIALILTMAVVVRAETIQTPAPMCAIDMGSNSFRRIVGSFEKGRYAQRNIEVMTLGVGDDLARHGRISDPKLAEVAEALSAFKAACEKEGVTRVAAIGTAAFREAPNGSRAVEIAAKLGIPMEIATEKRESELAYLVASLGHEGYAVIDNGSRSIELVADGQGSPRYVVFNLGYRLAYQEYFAAARDAESAASAFRDRLNQEALKAPFMKGQQKLVGVEFGEMADVLFEPAELEGRVLTLKQLKAKLLEITSAGTAAFQALKQEKDIDRALPRLVVAVALAEAFGYSQLELTARELGTGLIIEAGMKTPDGEVRRFDGKPVAVSHIDREAARLMSAAKVQGLAMAVVNDGTVVFVRSWGRRNVEKNLPLQTDTIMYGASLTKFAFAYMVMQLVDEGTVNLDRSIADYLPRPLPEYPFYAALAGDVRWRKLTPRILLSHTSGLANFAFLEPDEKMRLHFEPGNRYSYSGEGLILLQFVLETGLRLKVGDEMQRRVFDRFGMTRTSMTWRADFADNLADGYRIDGAVEPHDRRSNPRAAGSMDTTVADFAEFLAGFSRGEGLSAGARAEMLKAQIAITTPSQFPTLVEATSSAMKAIRLSAGLGVITFESPFGPAFFKGGHNDTTGNQAICVETGRRCVLFLSNDVRAESIYQRLTAATLGDPGMPWSWEGYTSYDQRVK